MRILPTGPAALADAARVLASDGIVVLPTDTVYGVAVRADRADGAAALAAAKGRSPDQPVAVLVGSREQADRVAVVDGPAGDLAAALWPGPLTLVVPRRATVDWDLGAAASSVGVRWPDHRFVTRLARRVGPLAVTSANRHGAPTAGRAAEAAADLAGRLDLVVDGGPCEGRPSTVVEWAEGRISVLREGAVPEERVTEIVDPR